MEENFRNIQNVNDPTDEEPNSAAANNNENLQISNDSVQNSAVPPNPAAGCAEITIQDPQVLIAVNKIRLNDPELQLEGLQYLRKSLAKTEAPPIDDVIKTGICKHIISLSYEKDDDQFVFEATWVFTNILSGTSEQARYLLQLGVLPFLFSNFKKNNNEIKEQVMWAFGNVAGESAECRDMILNHEKITYIYEFLTQVDFTCLSLIKTLSWVVSNFIRGKPSPNPSKVMPLYPFLKKVILEVNDLDAVTDATWGCSYLSDVDGNFNAFQNESFIEKIIGQLSSSNSSLMIASLRTLGNISSSLANSFEMFFRLGFLEKIDELIANPKSRVRKEICWMLSNICAEKREAVDSLLEIKFYEKLLKVLKEDCEEVKKEALWVICNTATVCNLNQSRRIAQIGLIGEMISALEEMKVTQKIVLEGLTEYFDKDKNIVGDEEKARLVGILDKLIVKNQNSVQAASLRLKLIDINNNGGK